MKHHIQSVINVYAPVSLQSGCKLKGKETEIQPELEPESSKLWSNALTTELLELWHWSRDINMTQFHVQVLAGSQFLFLSVYIHSINNPFLNSS